MVLSVCELAIGGLFAASGLWGFNNTDALDADVVSELASIGADPAGAALALAAFGVALALCGIIMLPVGVLGRRSAKNPAKITPFVVLNAIILALNAVISAIQIATSNLSAEVLTVALVPLFFQALALYCAVTIKRLYARGEIKPAEGTGKQGLGFIRVVQVLFALNILATLVSCTMLISGSYTLGTTEILGYVNLVLDGVAFWFITQRSKATRWWIIGTGLLNITVGTVVSVASGEFSILERLISSAFDIVLVVYFGFAKRPREVLTEEFSLERRKEMVLASWDLWKPKTWDFWRSMIIYFCLFSIVGHWMEAGFCLFIKWGIVPGIYDPNSGIWRDYLNPFPVYGFGMVACALLLFPIKTKLQEKLGGTAAPLACSFVINTVVCAGIELALGLMQNMPDANGVYPLWDYSTMPFNFMGQICLQNSLAFGTVATLMAWVVFPALQRVYLKLPSDVKKAFFVAVVAFYALVTCLYVVNIAV